MNSPLTTEETVDGTVLRQMNWWDRFVIGLFRGTVRRYAAMLLARGLERGVTDTDDIVNLIGIQDRMMAGDIHNAGFRVRMLLVTPLWLLAKLVGTLKNDHPFAKDTRESFTNKVTPEAIFLGFLVWLCALLAIGSVILHKAPFAP